MVEGNMAPMIAATSSALILLQVSRRVTGSTWR
jgi:hypothetical protein